LIVCYAEGGGLGHLTRLRAFLHTAGYDGRPVTVLTGSPLASDPRIRAGWDVQCPPADQLARTLINLRPDEVIIDAFPAGLHGEITASALPPGSRVTHLARLLRWDAYRPLLPDVPPRFDRTYLLEDPAPAHLDHLRAHSAELTSLELADPPSAEVTDALPDDAWVIVHSGPEEEIRQLVAYARDVAALEGVRPEFVLVCPGRHRPTPLPGGIVHLDSYPVRLASPETFTGMVFTAAGFNSVRRLAPWRTRHRMLPFPRTLDDQFARASRARAEAGDQSSRSNSTPMSSASLSAPNNAE
jgi:hypothetical protein